MQTRCLTQEGFMPFFSVLPSQQEKKVTALSGDIIFATSTPLTISIPAVFCIEAVQNPTFIRGERDLWPELPIAMGALKKPNSQDFWLNTLEKLVI